jgi:hypothetical protein
MSCRRIDWCGCLPGRDFGGLDRIVVEGLGCQWRVGVKRGSQLLLEWYVWLVTRRWVGLLVVVLLVLLTLVMLAGIAGCQARNLDSYSCGPGISAP